ncbi:MAG: hypothetical protein J1F23_00770 [Oscillospiraceae bacterium]|nr:hypothetical protein [Oscillospiraceae bacterium]
MKKFLSVLVAVTVIALSCLLPVSAGTATPSEPTGGSEIYAERTEDISVTYPADVEIPWNTEGDFEIGTIYAERMVIAAHKKVVISVTSQNDCALVGDGGSIPYTLGGADAIEFTVVNDTTVFPLNVNVAKEDWNAAPAGDYSDILTFTLSYVEK